MIQVAVDTLQDTVKITGLSIRDRIQKQYALHDTGFATGYSQDEVFTTGFSIHYRMKYSLQDTVSTTGYSIHFKLREGVKKNKH